MRKIAEEIALKVAAEKYPHGKFDGEEGDSLRAACAVGYLQAEKDLGWHSVDECLPSIDEEVIVLRDEANGRKLPSASLISFAHRPNPEGRDLKSLDTGEVKHYETITYDGWNVPGVKYWMPMPELKEDEK